MILSILSLVMFVSFISATTSTVIDITNITKPTSVAENAGSFTFTFNLTYTGASESASISFVDSTTSIGSISIPTATAMNGTINESRVITGTINNFANQGGNTMNVVINATYSSSRDDENTFSVSIESTTEDPEEITECNLVGDNGNLRISIDKISIEEGFGKKREWFPLDTIEVKIEVDNKGDEKIKDIVVGWGLYDLDQDDWVFDDEESDFNLKDGDDETLIITFELDDPDDFEDGGDYVFYVWATGEDEEFDGDETCVSDSEEIEIVLESDWVILTDFDYLDTVQCGSSVTISADVWNIGDDDQDDVSVVVYNKELGIFKEIDMGDIDAFDKEVLNVILEIPEDADEKWYSFKFEVRDEDNEVYENDFDDEEAIFTVNIKIEGNCGIEKITTLVTASLESGGQAGEELVVKAVITNIGDELATYTLNAAGYADWASSVEIGQETFILDKGESNEVLITFNVNKDALGTKFFDLEVVSENELVATQPVSVSIEKKAFSFSNNSYLWIIGALNIILIVIIVVVAVRLARK